ncbi:MAG TPA: glycosyltransferase family 4 protein [Steroidobacteraceae bacterium]
MFSDDLHGSAPALRGRRRLRLLFVEQFYYPDGWGGAELPLDLTSHLARRGFAVEVICGTDQYAPLEGEPPADPRLLGVRIRRIPRLLPGNVHRGKLLRQLWFYLALAPLVLLRRPPDVFVAQTNPPLGVILVAVAAKLWRRPLIIIAMDIYPEVLIAHGVAGSDAVSTRLLRGAFGWAYRRAQRIVALGPVMRERLEAKGISSRRIVEIPNWATGTQGLITGADNKLRLEWGLADKFVLLYSGNLGLAHEFETFLQGVRQAAKSVPALRLVFIGRGSRLQEVRRRIAELDLEAIVRFNDLLPPARLPESFGLAQLAVVTLQPAFAGLVVPSKLPGYMARGMPVLYVGPDSDIERFVKGSGGGVCQRTGDVQAVRATLIELAHDRERLAALGVRGRRYYEEQFAVQHGLMRYEAVIREVLDGASLPVS